MFILDEVVIHLKKSMSTVVLVLVTTGIEPIPLQPLLSAFETTINNLDVKFRNVTILRFGFYNVYMILMYNLSLFPKLPYGNIRSLLKSLQLRMSIVFIQRYQECITKHLHSFSFTTERCLSW